MHQLQTFILKLAVQFIPLHMLLIIEKQLRSPQLSGICSTFVHIENYVCLVFANQDKQKQKKGKTIYSFPMHTRPATFFSTRKCITNTPGQEQQMRGVPAL